MCLVRVFLLDEREGFQVTCTYREGRFHKKDSTLQCCIWWLTQLAWHWTPPLLSGGLTLPGWLLFMVFAGVGLVAFPMDCIKAFVGRPRHTITRSDYIKRAQGLGNRAKQIKVQLSCWLNKVGGEADEWREHMERVV